MAQYNIRKLNDNSPFQIYHNKTVKGLPINSLTSINSEGTLILDFVDYTDDENNVFIYENNKIRLASDPTMVMSWDDKNKLVVLFKENVGINMIQNISIGFIENSEYPILYIGNCSFIDASTYVLTILPKGLGFFPLNINHLLPLKLVKYKDCSINKLSKYNNCKEKENKIEGFKNISIPYCYYYFILLILLMFYIKY